MIIDCITYNVLRLFSEICNNIIFGVICKLCLLPKIYFKIFSSEPLDYIKPNLTKIFTWSPSKNSLCVYMLIWRTKMGASTGHRSTYAPKNMKKSSLKISNYR